MIIDGLKNQFVRIKVKRDTYHSGAVIAVFMSKATKKVKS